MKRKVLRKLLTKIMLYSTGTKNTVEVLKVLIVKYSTSSKSTVEVGYIKRKNYGRLSFCSIPQKFGCASSES